MTARTFNDADARIAEARCPDCNGPVHQCETGDRGCWHCDDDSCGWSGFVSQVDEDGLALDGPAYADHDPAPWQRTPAWDAGYADGVHRTLNCCGGLPEELRGRREAFRRALDRMDETLRDHERQARDDAEAERR